MLDISPNLFWPHGARNHQNDPQRNKNTQKWLILGLGVLTYGIVHDYHPQKDFSNRAMGIRKYHDTYTKIL